MLGRGRIRRARARIAALEGAQRTRTNGLLILATAALLVILPLFAGKLTNELLANVGLFVLLALIGVLGGPKQPGLLAEFSEFKLLIYGALLIWMMLAKPEGLILSVRRSRELHQQEMAQDAWLKGQVDDDDGHRGEQAAAVT